MILAAGEGRRMRPLTDHVPKPLLPVAGIPLIERHIVKLRDAGFTDIVVNVSYLGYQIERALGDGSAFGVRIHISQEDEPLETAGGVAKALPWLGSSPFVLVNGDVWTDYPLQNLHQVLPPERGAHLILVNNPAHHAGGDFSLSASARVTPRGAAPTFTFSGLSVLQPDMIRSYPRLRERFPLLEVLQWAMSEARVTGEHFPGLWVDVGTPERLEQVSRLLASESA